MAASRADLQWRIVLDARTFVKRHIEGRARFPDRAKHAAQRAAYDRALERLIRTVCRYEAADAAHAARMATWHKRSAAATRGAATRKTRKGSI